MGKKDLLTYEEIAQTRVLIRGAGEMASGVAHRLFKSGFKVCFTEISLPLAVRRLVSFCEAVYDHEKTVEEVTARRITKPAEIFSVWEEGKIPLLVDSENKTKDFLNPHVLIDAILAKRNIGTKITHAPLVVGLGPGFKAAKDVHVVIETNRGHNLGRLIFEGEAEPNTGVPGIIAGYGMERVIRAPQNGKFKILKDIGDMVSEGETVAHVEGAPISANISGIIRGLLRDGTEVTQGLKAGDIDPRGERSYCTTISEKARALGGSVLEAILSQLPKRLREEKK
jgi:xanthine dehydrogenase accessory factor